MKKMIVMMMAAALAFSAQAGTVSIYWLCFHQNDSASTWFGSNIDGNPAVDPSDILTCVVDWNAYGAVMSAVAAGTFNEGMAGVLDYKWGYDWLVGLGGHTTSDFFEVEVDDTVGSAFLLTLWTGDPAAAYWYAYSHESFFVDITVGDAFYLTLGFRPAVGWGDGEHSGSTWAGGPTVVLPVPEPATGLLALAGIALLIRRKRK